MNDEELEQHIAEVNKIIDETRANDASDEVVILVAEVLRLRGLRQADAVRVASASRQSRTHERYVRNLEQEASQARWWKRQYENLLEVRIADQDACTCRPRRRLGPPPSRVHERRSGLRTALAACGIPIGR